MTIDVSRELDGTYLVLRHEEEGDRFAERMLEEARPEHLLALSGRGPEPGSYRFDISGRRSLESSCYTREITAEEIRELMGSIYRILGEAEEYLLDPRELWLEPSVIYRGRNGWEFLLDPCRREDPFGQIRALSCYILKKCNRDDPAASELGFELFQVCHEDNFSFTQIFEALDMRKESPAQEEAPAGQPKPERPGLWQRLRGRKSRRRAGKGPEPQPDWEDQGEFFN